jgi:hypothetical protein
MSTRLLKFLLPLLFLLTLASCEGATYSKERVEQSVVELCKNEYDLDVEAKIIGSTLGVFIPIEGLVDPDLKLDQDAGEKIEDVALSIHRVIMSTDKPLKIYTLTARDAGAIGAEFILTGFVYDVVRVRLLDISRGEYHKRILRDFRFNSIVTGAAKIRELLDAANKNSPSVQKIKHLFYPIFTIGAEGSQKIEITDIEAKEISEQEALFYIKTREYYEPIEGFEVYKAIFPPGFQNEYLILTNITLFPNPIKEIVSKYFYSGTEIRQRNLSDTFGQYKDTGYIGIDGLPKNDLDPGWFLSQQIARRIKILFGEDKRLRGRFTVQDSQGLIDSKVFRFTFSISSEEPTIDDEKIIFSRILKLAGEVTHRYGFEDFEGIELLNTSPGGKKLYLSKADLEKFRRNRLKIKDILL